jgi:hypothetical protein
VDRKAPWFQIKEDKAAAATTVYVILRAVDSLKTILAPILPHTAQILHEFLATHHRKGVGYDGQLFGMQEVVEYQEETHSHEALNRLCFVLSITSLYLVSQGTVVVEQGKRRWVDDHWFRRNSYLKIGWNWINHALSKSWDLIARLYLSGPPRVLSPPPAR